MDLSFPEKDPDPHVVLLQESLGELLAGIELTGFEVVRLMRAIGNQYAQEAAVTREGASISGPRWLLLLRLYVEEARGEHLGVQPGYLSRCEAVSKNTISVLLRGLEDQGYVERTLDSEDRRGFRIRLTAAGRKLVRSIAPSRLAHLNTLVEGLRVEERAELIRLLSKLYRSFAARAAARPAADELRP